MSRAHLRSRESSRTGRRLAPSYSAHRHSRRLAIELLEGWQMLAVLLVNVSADNRDPNDDLTLREAIAVVNHGDKNGTIASLGRALTPGEFGRVSGNVGLNDRIQFDASLNGDTIGLALNDVVSATEGNSALGITKSVVIDAGALDNGLILDASPLDPISHLDPNSLITDPDLIDLDDLPSIIRREDSGIIGVGDGSRVLRIDDANVINVIDVELIGLTLTGGDVGGSGDHATGSGILSVENATLRDVTVTGNLAIKSPFVGSEVGVFAWDTAAGIYHRADSGGTLRILDGSHVSDNIGGGLFFNSSSNSPAARLEIRDSVISGNRGLTFLNTYGAPIEQKQYWGTSTINSLAQGATIVGYGEITSDIRQTVIASNSGGGLEVHNLKTALEGARGSFSLADSYITENGAGGNAYLGGVFVNSDKGRSTISGTTISQNEVGLGGGGLHVRFRDGSYVDNSTLAITNSTISGNSGGQYGGGIAMFSRYSAPLVSVSHTTITENNAGIPGHSTFSQGSGVWIGGEINQGTTFSHTIISNNQYADGVFDDISDVFVSTVDTSNVTLNAQYSQFGIVAAGGARPNVDYDIEFSPASVSSAQGVLDPLLGPLADNGGRPLPTLGGLPLHVPTHEPQAGSPVVDAGDPAAVPGQDSIPLFDQRGNPYNRIADTRIDIGAVELQTTPADCPVGDYNDNGVVDAADYSIWRDRLGTNFTLPNEHPGVTPGMVTIEDYDVWRSQFGEICEDEPAGHGALMDPGPNSLHFSSDFAPVLPQADSNPAGSSRTATARPLRPIAIVPGVANLLLTKRLHGKVDDNLRGDSKSISMGTNTSQNVALEPDEGEIPRRAVDLAIHDLFG